MNAFRPAPRSRPRGAALISAVVLALSVAGLAYGLLGETEASRHTVVRSEAKIRSLELAEIGLCRVESSLVQGLTRELMREADAANGTTFVTEPPLWETVDDGLNPAFLRLVLPVTAYGNGTFDVTATCPVTDPQHQHYARRWTVTSHGRIDDAGLAGERWIECGYWLRTGNAYVDGLLSLEEMILMGTVTTDSYDSSLGSYASQVDPVTGLGDFGGSLGSNSDSISGTGTVLINGDAIPGPDDATVMGGGATVVGETEPRNEEREFEATPIEEFQDAYTAFAAGTWDNATNTYTMGGVPTIIAAPGVNVNIGRITPTRKYVDWAFVGNGTVTFPGGTYFFNNFTASAGTILQFTGETKIYVTESFDAGGATFVNSTPNQRAANVQIFAHPYGIPAAPRLPGSSTEWTPEVKLAGGPNSAWVMYGLEAKLTVTGNAEIFGAAVARWIDLSGTSEYHYDRALDWALQPRPPRLERRYWREVNAAGGAMDVRR
jgi:hypothetical protein